MTRRCAQPVGHAVSVLWFLRIATGVAMAPACVGAGDDNVSAAAATDGGAAATDATKPKGDGSPPSGDSSTATGETPNGEARAPGDAAAGSGDATVADAAAPPSGGAVAQFNPATIDIGRVGCGQMMTQAFSIKNVGTGKLSVSARVTGDAFLASGVTPESLVLGAGQVGTLAVGATVPGAEHAGTQEIGSLNLFTTDPNHANVTIRLTATATGAELSVGAATVDFGTAVPLGGEANSSATIQNFGNAPGTFVVTPPLAGNEFHVLGYMNGVARTVSWLGGQSRTLNVSFDPTYVHVGGASASGTIGISLAGSTLCGGALPQITLTGTGVASVNPTGYPSALTFNAKCGGAAPDPQTFAITNGSLAGGQTLTARFDDTAFTVQPPSTTFGDAGSALQFTVHAPPFPSQATGPNSTPAGSMPAPRHAKLTLAVNGAAPVVIPVTVNPVGASLTFDTQSLIFDSVAVHGALSRGFRVINSGSAGTGNVTLSVVDAAPGAPVFTVDTPQFAVAAGREQGENATFTPRAIGPRSAEIHLAVDSATVLCAALPPPLPASGSGSGVGVSPSDLTFYVPCDGQTSPSPLTFTLTNATNNVVTWTVGGAEILGPGRALYHVVNVASADGGMDDDPDLVRTLGPSESATLSVASTGILPTAAAQAGGGVLLDDAGMPWTAPSPAALAAVLRLPVQFTDGTTAGVAVVRLDEVPVGDQLSVTIGGVPVTTLPSFGTVAAGVATPPAQTVTVTNAANRVPAGASLAYAGANVTVATAGAFAAFPGSFSVGAGATAPVNISFTPTGVDSTPKSATVRVGQADPSAPLCAPLPPLIAVSGTGTQGKPAIPSGDFVPGTSVLDFGLVGCGTTGPSKTFIVSNEGNQAFDILTAAFNSPASPYALTVSGPSGQTLPNPGMMSPIHLAAGTQVSFTVAPILPSEVDTPGDPLTFADALTLTTNAYGDTTPHVVTLAVRAQGAIIAALMPALGTTWDFGHVDVGMVGKIEQSVQNTGNAPVTVTLSAGAGQALPSVFALGPTEIPPGTTTSIVAQFTPSTSLDSWTGQGSLIVTGTLCKPLPAEWGTAAMPAIVHLSGKSN